MKKLFYMISAVALMASFASCNKMVQDNNTPATDETPATDGTTTLTLSASLPQTKTYLNEGLVKWTKGDMLTVLAKGVEKTSSSTNGVYERYNFTVEGWPSGVTPQYAVFNGPQGEGNEDYKPVMDQDEKIITKIRSSQVIYQRNTFGKMSNLSIGELSTREEGGYTTIMKNVCGLLKFGLTKNAHSVIIEDVDGRALTGEVKVVMENGEPKVDEVISENPRIEIISKLSDSDETLLGDNSSYYAVVLPGTYRLRITINAVENDPEPKVLTAKNTVTVVRNKYHDLKTIDDVTIAPEPSELKTIVVDFANDQPFDKRISGNANQNPCPGIYNLLDGDESYEFIINSKNGYVHSATNDYFRLTINTGTKEGYIKLPAVQNFVLSRVELTGNSSYSKAYYIESSDPFDENTPPTLSNMISVYKIDTDHPTQTGAIELSGLKTGTSYYLYTNTNNAQLCRIVLTYARY